MAARGSGISVGIDPGPRRHWGTALLANGHVGLAGLTENTPVAITGLVAEIGLLGEPITVGFATLGGRATLIQAMMAEAGLPIVLVAGMASRRSDGEASAAVANALAERVRRGRGLRPVDPATELDPEICLLAGQRRIAAVDLAGHLGRLRETVAAACPGLERILDLDPPGPLVLLQRFPGVEALRAAGWDGALEALRAAGDAPNAEAVIERAFTAIQTCPASDTDTAPRIEALAVETLRAEDALTRLDRTLVERAGTA